MSSLQRLIDLQALCLAFSHVERRLVLPEREGKTHNETDTEHSYSLAMAAWYLTQDLPHLDTDKCMRYALVHDLQEIYAGDTFAYDKVQEVHETKAARERQGIETLKHDWPDFVEMNDYIEGYEQRQDPESRFVYALDKLMPMIINHLTEGKNYRREGVRLSDVKAFKAHKVAVSPEVYELYQELIAIFENKPEYFA